MCVAVGPANLGRTKIYMGEANHPVHGYVHVVGYQNQPVDQRAGSEGGNAMLLHFPSAEPMGRNNIIEMGDDGWLETMCQAMDEAYFPARRGGGPPPKIEVFESGIYHVVLASDPNLIPTVLDQVPPEKRPAINPEVFGWYAERLSGWSVLLACFNNRDTMKDSQDRDTAPPIWVWYKPLNPSILTAPGIDAHDGHAPNLAIPVKVDTSIVVGCLKSDFNVGRPFSYFDGKIPEAFKPFAPGRLRAHDFRRTCLNRDYAVKVADLGTSQGTSQILTREMIPPGYAAPGGSS